MNNYRGLQEAYEAVYNQELRQQLVEKKEFETTVNEVFYTIAITMVAEGYTIDQVIQYFAEEEVDNIVETYYNCDLSQVSLTEEIFNEQFKDYITEAPNPILSPLLRQIQQAGGRVVSPATSTATSTATSAAKKPNLAMQNLQALGGGLRNVATASYLVPTMIAKRIFKGKSMTQQGADLARLTPQERLSRSSTSQILGGIEAQGKRNVAGAVDFIKKKVAPVALGAGVLSAGGTGLYVKGGYDKETEILKQRAQGK